MYTYCYIDSYEADALTDGPSDFEKIQLDFPQLREYLDKLFEDKAAIPARQYNFYIIIRTKICCLQQDLVNTIKSFSFTSFSGKSCQFTDKSLKVGIKHSMFYPHI